MMLKLDHIAVAAQTLAEGTNWVQDLLGVPLQPGGQHAHYGTHNTLLGLGDLYLEVIARDPAAAPTGRPTWFGLDHFSGPPRLANWICQADDLTPAAAITGPPVALSRGDLNWHLTVPEDGSLPFEGAYPTLIKWDNPGAHPAGRLTDCGVRLTEWAVFHPQAQSIASQLNIQDDRVVFRDGPAGFRATFDTPSGPKVIR